MEYTIATIKLTQSTEADSVDISDPHREAGVATSDEQECERNAAIHACILASVVTRRAAELAFREKGRSMTAPDVIEHLGRAFVDIHPEG